MRVFPSERHETRRAAPLVSLLALLLAQTLLAPTPLQAQEQYDPSGRWVNGVSEPWWFDAERHAKEDIEAAQRRWRLLGEELADAPRGGWAGDYFIGGETHGSYLRWSPRGGFVLFKVNKCAAQVDDFAFGTVDATPSLVRLLPERDMTPADAHAHGHHMSGATSLLPVSLRGARLLVPEDEMAEFGDYVAGLGKFNQQQFIYYDSSYTYFHRMTDEDIDADARASDAVAGTSSAAVIVPAGYERFLKRPVEGKITRVGRREVKNGYDYQTADGSGEHHDGLASVTPVTVNVGTRHGAAAGMVLRAPATGEEIKLTRAGAFSSTGVVVRSLDEHGRETFYDHAAERQSVYPRVAVGWRLTTSPF
ncbi:MAG TPA: hypothetical protein VFX96_18265 [Pyrinomonadaceae bacterium]|nr:hypothetical protein [Pyrinomonadaceae bacterium]